jgi:hypothetical protein
MIMVAGDGVSGLGRQRPGVCGGGVQHCPCPPFANLPTPPFPTLHPNWLPVHSLAGDRRPCKDSREDTPCWAWGAAAAQGTAGAGRRTRIAHSLPLTVVLAMTLVLTARRGAAQCASFSVIALGGGATVWKTDICTQRRCYPIIILAARMQACKDNHTMNAHYTPNAPLTNHSQCAPPPPSLFCSL